MIQKETEVRERNKTFKEEKARKKLYTLLEKQQINGNKIRKHRDAEADFGKVIEKRKILRTKKGEKTFNSDSEEEEDTFCLVCLKPYTVSKLSQDWKMYFLQKLGSHQMCRRHFLLYLQKPSIRCFFIRQQLTLNYSF